jgi:hypothetical protein
MCHDGFTERYQFMKSTFVPFRTTLPRAAASQLEYRPRGLFAWKPRVIHHTAAIFRQVNKDNPRTHHDALEFSDGQMVLLTDLLEGQGATVLQLPAQPVTAAEIKAQERVRHVG